MLRITPLTVISLSLWLLSSLPLAFAAKVTYDFNISWVMASPDGFNRPTIGINGKWPIPQITANLGDRVVVNVLNSLGNQSTSLHFHGLFQNGTSHMDGPSRVTQCEIAPGARMTYEFTLDQPGTYWYHSHTHGQYPDGLRGPLIVNDPESPFKGRHDEELVLTVSDWYHQQVPTLMKRFISKTNPTGAEPVPDSVLVNETQNLKVQVLPGKTYLFRSINVGAFAGQYIWFEGHTMIVVEVDGVYTQSAEAKMIYLGSGQRCSFLVTTKNETGRNYAFVTSMDTELFDAMPESLQYNSSNWLVYDNSKPFPEASLIDEFEPLDDLSLVPWDNVTLFDEPDQIIPLEVIMDNLGDGANYAFFNNITYVAPKVPTLYTALSSGALATNPGIYGSHTNSFVLEHGHTVEVVINNLDDGKHPFHLHGHNFQILYRSEPDAGLYIPGKDVSAPAIPIRRDTVVVNGNGFAVLRFRADNPGIWLFHCHIEWHVQSGLIATFVEAPLELQAKTAAAGGIPRSHLDACAAAGVQTAGNAAGKTGDALLDLTGEPAPAPPLPQGFTTRGKIALAFSCLAGILGVLTVGWYGLAPVPSEGDQDVGHDGNRGDGALFRNEDEELDPGRREEIVVASG